MVIQRPSTYKSGSMYIYIYIYILKENNTYGLKACIYIYSGSMYIYIYILKENNIYMDWRHVYNCVYGK